MPDFKTFTYKNLYTGSIRVDECNRVSYKETNPLRAQKTLYKMAVVPLETYTRGDDPTEYIRNYSRNYPTMSKTERIFVSGDCKTNRDLFRNTGYKITRDKQNAEAIIFPALPQYYDMFQVNADVAAYDPASESLYLFVMTNAYGQTNPKVSFDDTAKLAVTEFFTEQGMEVVFVCYTRRAYFMRPCEEWREILEERKVRDSYGYTIDYISETRLPLDLPIDINLETLQIWENERDSDMLAKAICQSNWQEYPATLCLFLKKHPNFYSSSNTNFQLITYQINYANGSFGSLWSGKTIQPKDWNLLQAWCLHKLNAPEEGGIVNKDLFRNTSNDVKTLVRRATIVKPLYITTPQTLNQLLTLVSN